MALLQGIGNVSCACLSLITSMCRVSAGVDLSVCEAWPRGSRSRAGASRSRPLVTCCTRQMEARLTTHARHELSRLLTDKLNDVRHDLSNVDNDFESMSLIVFLFHFCEDALG